MPPHGLPFVNVITDGKSAGRRWYYFRTKETGNIKLPGSPQDPAFHRAYADAVELRARLMTRPASPVDDPDSMAWLIDRYQKSREFKALADITQVGYVRTLAILTDQLGDQPFKLITRKMIKAVRDDYGAQARKANKVQQMASRLYSWAEESDLVPAGFNPATGLKKLKRKGGEQEIAPWSDQDVAWILSVAPAHIVTPILIALYTGQRRQDVVAMTWQQWQGDWIQVRQSKTGALLDLPCHPVLKAHLDRLRKTASVVSLAGPICLTQAGKPFSPDGLSGALGRVVRRHPQVADNRSFHGLRYAAAGRMEEGGAGIAAIEAVLGHRTLKMAMKYASARLRAREGVAAMKGTNDA